MATDESVVCTPASGRFYGKSFTQGYADCVNEEIAAARALAAERCDDECQAGVAARVADALATNAVLASTLAERMTLTCDDACRRKVAEQLAEQDAFAENVATRAGAAIKDGVASKVTAALKMDPGLLGDVTTSLTNSETLRTNLANGLSRSELFQGTTASLLANNPTLHAGLEPLITHAKDSLNECTAEVAKAKGVTAAAQAGIDAAKADAAAAKADVDAVKEDVDAAKEDAAAVKDSVATHGNKLAEHGNKLDDINITANEYALSDLKRDNQCCVYEGTNLRGRGICFRPGGVPDLRVFDHFDNKILSAQCGADAQLMLYEHPHYDGKKCMVARGTTYNDLQTCNDIGRRATSLRVNWKR